MARTGYILRKLRARVADRPTGFLWLRDSELAASGYPSSKKQVAWLRKQGIIRVLTLTESPLPADWTRGLEVKHVPMKDHEPPGYDSLLEASSYIEESLAAKKRTLVHCLAGQGRTMCAVAAWLIVNGMTEKEALEYLRRVKPGAVESGQEASLLDFESRFKKTNGAVLDRDKNSNRAQA